jgi:hypothetical protein
MFFQLNILFKLVSIFNGIKSCLIPVTIKFPYFSQISESKHQERDY